MTAACRGTRRLGAHRLPSFTSQAAGSSPWDRTPLLWVQINTFLSHTLQNSPSHIMEKPPASCTISGIIHGLRHHARPPASPARFFFAANRLSSCVRLKALSGAATFSGLVRAVAICEPAPARKPTGSLSPISPALGGPLPGNCVELIQAYPQVKHVSAGPLSSLLQWLQHQVHTMIFSHVPNA